MKEWWENVVEYSCWIGEMENPNLFGSTTLCLTDGRWWLDMKSVQMGMKMGLQLHCNLSMKHLKKKIFCNCMMSEFQNTPLLCGQWHLLQCVSSVQNLCSEWESLQIAGEKGLLSEGGGRGDYHQKGKEKMRLSDWLLMCELAVWEICLWDI